MTEAVEKQATPIYLVAARHLVGLTVLLAINPLNGIGSNWAGDLLFSFVGVLVVTSVLWGIYALFFTARAKRQWPTGFFLIAWVVTPLAVLGWWKEYEGLKTAGKSPPQPATTVSVQQPALPRTAITIEQAALQIERAYPYLGTPQGARALELIILERDAWISQGVSPVQALYTAAERIAPKHQPDSSAKP